MAPRAGRNFPWRFLGDFTDEVEGDPIIEFASGGAKNYGYETRGGKVECKVRGFSLNYRNKLLLNFYALRDNILQELEDPQDKRREIKLVDKNFFDRDQTNKGIRLIEREKGMGKLLTNVWWTGPLENRIPMDAVVFETKWTCFRICK